MSEQPQEIVYRKTLPLAEMVEPEVPWKAGDRVVSKYDGEAGVIHDVENFENDGQNVAVIFDYDPSTLAWICDFDVRKEA